MSEERDRDVDVAWRAASREEPPPALDDAIRAEARRAVSAGPAEARRRRYRQWRYPFAAAATVALLAFGIAQMTPPDRVEPAIVSDQPAAPRERASQSQAPAQPSPRPQPPAQPREPFPAQTPQAPQPQRAQNAPASVPEPADATASRRRRSPALDAQARKDVPRNESTSDERFVAAPAQPETRLREQAQNAGSPPPESRRDESAEAGKIQPDVPAAAGAIKPRPSAAPVAVAKVSHLDEVKAKEAGAESVEAWIARIRELRASGQMDAVAKELLRFRETYGERADALLPADLRAVAASKP
jgi:hypothetical protein